MKVENYILDEHNNAVPEPDIMKWAKWIEGMNRRVAYTEVGDYHVSTVFLGLDYSFSDNPDDVVLFETITFENAISKMKILDRFHDYHKELKLPGTQQRYATYNEALKGHEAIVKIVKDYQGLNEEHDRTTHQGNEGTDKGIVSGSGSNRETETGRDKATEYADSN